MPFTLAHPAAVFPLAQKPLQFSALVAGSVAPDLPYFMALTTSAGLGRFSHSATGSVFFCVPAGMLLLWLYHRVVKRPLMRLVPATHRQLFPAAVRFAFGPASNAVWIVLSILIGAWTHLIWDAFTHPHGWAVERWPLLAQRLFTVDGFPITVFKLLQYGSSVVGLLALAGYALHRFGGRSRKQHETEVGGYRRHEEVGGVVGTSFSFWMLAKLYFPFIALGAVAGLTGIIFGYFEARPIHGFHDLRVWLVSALIAAVSTVVVVVVLYCIAWHGLRRAGHSR